MALSKSVPALLMLAALSQTQLAYAQTSAPAKPCVSEQEVSALLIYAAPSLIQGVSLRCEKNLAANGYLATQGGALAGRFSEKQAQVWPAAKKALLKLVDKPDQANLVRQLPDEVVRPLFGPVVSQMIVRDVKPSDCGRIERGLKLLSPLPVDSIGEISGFLLGLAPAGKGPKVCPYVAPASQQAPRRPSPAPAPATDPSRTQSDG